MNSQRKFNEKSVDARSQWLKRSRSEHGLSYQVTGMKLKVSWAKILRRTRVLLVNQFRLRRFWESCDTDSDAQNFDCADDMDLFLSSCLLCPLVHRRVGHVASIIVQFNYRSDILRRLMVSVDVLYLFGFA